MFGFPSGAIVLRGIQSPAVTPFFESCRRLLPCSDAAGPVPDYRLLGPCSLEGELYPRQEEQQVGPVHRISAEGHLPNTRA
jgi:hypothetical protein